MFPAQKIYLNRALLLLGSLFALFLCAGNAYSELATLSRKVIVDSQEPFNCRVYSYDMGIDSSGGVHIVYSNPNQGCTKASVSYVRRIDGVWQPPIVLSNNGLAPSISTLLAIGNDDIIHICYVQGSTDTLRYITVNNGVVGTDIHVDDGGWHTRMQLNENNRAIFVRENKTWPALETKLALLTTLDGTTWNKKYLDLPSVTKFRIADFIYDNGKYHITYGGSEHLKESWDSKSMTKRVMEVFHDLHYAFSSDGQNWSEYTIDSSGTLHRLQFWTSLALDGGNPLASMYKFNEYAGRYNFGTSANLMTKSGLVWNEKIITDTSFPDNLEGMGPGLVVNGSGDYFGAWDFSPPDTHDDEFRGIDGNIVLARNGFGNNWTARAQIAPFSLEGRAILQKHDGKIFFLGLGNWRDAKLYFREYSLSELNKILPWANRTRAGTVIPGIYQLLMDN